MSEGTPKTTRTALDDALGALPSLREIAAQAGIPYDTMRSWASGRRTPQPETLQIIADVLEAQGTRLVELAQVLRTLVDRVRA